MNWMTEWLTSDQDESRDGKKIKSQITGLMALLYCVSSESSRNCFSSEAIWNHTSQSMSAVKIGYKAEPARGITYLRCNNC